MGAPTGFTGFAGGIGSSFIDLVTSLQNMVQAANTVADALNSQIPHFTSGQLIANTLIVLPIPTANLIPAFSISVAGAANGISLSDLWLDTAIANDGVLISVIIA